MSKTTVFETVKSCSKGKRGEKKTEVEFDNNKNIKITWNETENQKDEYGFTDDRKKKT